MLQRFIRATKDRRITMTSSALSMPIDLPEGLLEYIVSVLNLTPNATTGICLPYEIFYVKKPFCKLESIPPGALRANIPH